MPAYQNGSSLARIDGVDIVIEWTASECPYDFNGEWLEVAGAKLGHVHLHANTQLGRIQVWILEKWSWEEHFLKDLETDFGDVTIAMRKVLRNPTFISAVAHVQRTQRSHQV